MKRLRANSEPPEAIESWGWKYHHIGIPTSRKMPGEEYLPQFRVHASGFSKSPFGVEWMRYRKGSPVNELVRTLPHIAFEVKNLDYELKTHRFKIISRPNSPSEGVRAAMIEHNGAIIELIEFKNK